LQRVVDDGRGEALGGDRHQADEEGVVRGEAGGAQQVGDGGLGEL
jgi:hypothetical protein